MFWKNFILLCAEKGLSANAVAKELSISSGAITKWKNGTIPQNATLRKIADYFNVSVNYLLGKEKDTGEDRNSLDHLVLQAYQAADESTKKAVRKLLDIEEPTNRIIDDQSDPDAKLRTDLTDAFTKITS